MTEDRIHHDIESRANVSEDLPATIAPEEMIVRVRGHAVIIDYDLAGLYGV